ncbi:MAG TPA: ribose-phosphate pyrophosphokinase [Chitinophagaceae bacterium]|nr:ribose-phosphate pyrophosphokinase [Chitinophagaceae bacterium]
MKLFSLEGSRSFGELVAQKLHLSLSAHEERTFEDGECKVRPLENVRNQDVFVLHALYGDGHQDVHSKLCRLLFFIGALKDASARRVTAVVPYLCYSRKDRKTKPRDPVTTRYMARLLEAAGADAVVTMDVHNLQAFQNAFRIPAENLEARNLFAGYLADTMRGEDIVIMSPDFGGVKRAEQFLQTMEKRLGRQLALVVMEKYRSGGELWGQRISGEVRDKTVMILDDLISTGSTLARTCVACRQAGARRVIALATHGLFTGRAPDILANQGPEQILITNCVPPHRPDLSGMRDRITVLDAAPLFAEAIRRMEEGGSLVELLAD